MIDTLGYAKHLVGAGIDRPAAEAHAEAMNKFITPQLATSAQLDSAKTEIKADLTLRTIAIVATLNGLLFALLRLT